jgi:hypothetical protein
LRYTGGIVGKHKDKNSMAEDYLAHVEWENSHPLDKRGRPSWRYIPRWKYNKIYPRIGNRKPSFFGWIIISIFSILSVTVLGFILLFINRNFPGTGIIGIIALISIPILLYLITRR